MLTQTQEKLLQKYRKEGTINFSRSDYDILATIKKNCRNILENFQEALKIYLELTGGKK